jgi:pimeloyl-ACP methyl ester carboxylesterase
VLLLCLPLPGLNGPAAWAGPLHERGELDRVNARLAGHIVDYSANHGEDRRLFWPSLGKRMAMYVYLPPGYDPQQRYPGVIFMHGFHQDERSFLEEVAEPLDSAIRKGQLPPVIAIAPDGSIARGKLYHPGSFFINSEAGRYEDYIIHDVWGFLVTHYPIRPEREAHVLVGASMGGFGAYNLGIKHRADFKIVIGIFPPLNLRWVDCHGHYRSPFDPDCWGWRTELRRREVVGKFYGVFKVRLFWLTEPLFGNNPDPIAAISRENPIEMLDTYQLKPGDLCMYVGYGGKDEFNTTAQIQSFLYRAKERGLPVAVEFLPEGHHNYATAYQLLPGIINWLAPLLAPYSPPLPASCGTP